MCEGDKRESKHNALDTCMKLSMNSFKKKKQAYANHYSSNVSYRKLEGNNTAILKYNSINLSLSFLVQIQTCMCGNILFMIY